MTGLMTNSPTPSKDAILRDAPNEYATVTVASVPNILYDIVLRICLANTDSSFTVVT